MQPEFINMYLLLFLNRKSDSLWAGLRGQRCCWQEGRACHLIRDVSDSTAIPDELLFSPHVFTLILGRHIWSSPVSGRCCSSGDQGTWTWPCLEPLSPAPCSAAWCWWAVRLPVRTFGHCAQDLSRGTSAGVWSMRAAMNVPSKDSLWGPLGQPVPTTVSG